MAPKTLTKAEKAAKDKNKNALMATQRKVDIQFLESMSGNSDEKDLERLIEIIPKAVERGDEETLTAACGATVRFCESHKGLMILVKENGIGVDHIRWAAEQVPELQEVAALAIQQVAEKGITWAGNLDAVIDFNEIPDVVIVLNKLGCDSEELAIRLLPAMGSFAAHRAHNRVTMLHHKALAALHRVLCGIRAPEVIHETFLVLYRVCDVPLDILGKHLMEEPNIETTMIEAMSHAPLNLRLQMAGFRILSMWAQVPEHEVFARIQEAQALDALKKVLGNLDKAGFSHAFAWLDGVASRALRGDGRPPPPPPADPEED
eukprot:gnl/TRDRNA2_/TRDRNA2_185168_c0_seq1.p1 gnl/TRDRNA2_/TRDRNA2_185168_c0~~gnl/TRDRNA2_/TRDRNA2_185168_c0_seq1.p1  ORF type:complete len:319 (+),score=76.67 gnl/TRDRNA2_/TRDRNA2_185168_c0_seq1:100-1056(+)